MYSQFKDETASTYQQLRESIEGDTRLSRAFTPEPPHPLSPNLFRINVEDSRLTLRLTEYDIEFFSVGFCNDRGGNRLEYNELEDGVRPHTIEMLPFANGAPCYTHPDFPDVQSFYRTDKTDDHVDQILAFLLTYVDRNDAEVMDWLEGIRPGYSEEFGHVFEEYGVEDLSDVRGLDEEGLMELETRLTASGAQPLQLQQIRRHVCGLRIYAKVHS